MVERIKNGDIVRHFKKELYSEEDDSCLYKVININVISSEGVRSVVYSSLYNNDEKGIKIGDIFCRPYDEFMSEVDRNKYPDIKQKYRFEYFDPIIKIAIFDDIFEPDDEFLEVLKQNKKFCEINKYNISYNFKEIMTDKNIIEYIETHSTIKLMGTMCCKGKDSNKYKIGFAGEAHVEYLDRSKNWKIAYNRADIPYISYVDININEYGYIRTIRKIPSKYNKIVKSTSNNNDI